MAGHLSSAILRRSNRRDDGIQPAEGDGFDDAPLRGNGEQADARDGVWVDARRKPAGDQRLQPISPSFRDTGVGLAVRLIPKGRGRALASPPFIFQLRLGYFLTFAFFGRAADP